MSAPDAPEDHSLEIAQMERQDERRAARRERKDQRKEERELAELHGSARTSAESAAEQYFISQGLDPNDYTMAIDAAINEMSGRIPRDDPNPGSYYDDIGQTVFGQEQAGSRVKAQRELDRIFAPDFENRRISGTEDDDILASILGEQRGSAEDIIDNMLKRSVITDTGASAARKDLDRQSNTAKSRLNEIGTGQIAKGRQELRDVANRGRQTASTLNLGTQFDPYSYSSETDREFDEWLSGLGGNIRGLAPTDLFSTGSLASIAGQGSGAQNTKFSPNALAGILEDDEGDDDENQDDTPESIF